MIDIKGVTYILPFIGIATIPDSSAISQTLMFCLLYRYSARRVKRHAAMSCTGGFWSAEI